MFEYEVHRTRSAELLRRAERERLAREAVRRARAARHEAAERSAESEAHTGRPRDNRFPRVA
ncbi:hypothetical protein [Streptomyces chromofuscus]|uniref:Uncharacterized protein n=1 Tax=Streptomyces chromofuscus TaxID=42881 RepID=A0A7M2T4N3_STRCW|nr:hypothetical protein [Streptomyces chromofuscus]QOV43214.1 hypothetical protein IPT68_26105 [Streptomyces chromofuscus]GGT32548.1 hypothetical protein GCM10010254_61230 [Streptomyces chromofuscus]